MIAFNHDAKDIQTAYGLTQLQYQNLRKAINDTLYAAFHTEEGPKNKIHALEHFYNQFQPQTPVQAAIAAYEFGQAFQEKYQEMQEAALLKALKQQIIEK